MRRTPPVKREGHKGDEEIEKGGKKTVRLESGNLVGWMLTSESSQQGKLLRRSNVFKGLWILVVVVDEKQLHNSTFNQSQKDGAEAHMFTFIDRHFFFYLLQQWSSARSVTPKETSKPKQCQSSWN